AQKRAITNEVATIELEIGRTRVVRLQDGAVENRAVTGKGAIREEEDTVIIWNNLGFEVGEGNVSRAFDVDLCRVVIDAGDGNAFCRRAVGVQCPQHLQSTVGLDLDDNAGFHDQRLADRSRISAFDNVRIGRGRPGSGLAKRSRGHERTKNESKKSGK